MIGAIASAILAAVPSFATLTLDAAESRIVANSASVATTRALARQRESDLRLAKTGGDYEVRAGETIAEVLQRHGVPVRTSCELGYCGTCLTPYLAGEPDHRDQILEENGRQRYVLICCSRAKTPVLVLDL